VSAPLLRRIRSDELEAQGRDPVDSEALAAAGEIIDEVRRGGFEALVAVGRRFGDLAEGEAAVLSRDVLAAAAEALPAGQRALLERCATRIRAFAEAQRGCLGELRADVQGGQAGHQVAPVQRAGCYAPGGRYPLPSSVLMTVVTARAAGVEEVWVASPKPTEITKAAAYIAGADALLAVGGAQAIAGFAYGVGPLPACDVIVGPGNRFVTAAKKLVSGRVAIDMLAGPSELVIVADASADPGTVAADLLAQAEHDPEALPILISLAPELLPAVEEQLVQQLGELPTAEVAGAALRNGYVLLAADLGEAAELCDRIAPEHLELLVAEPKALAQRVQHYGGLFVGSAAAEVLGDYGVGPNHVLPTGGTARSTGGLSVFTFLRIRTWLELEPGPELAALVEDAAELARLEGLEGHARSAERRTAE